MAIAIHANDDVFRAMQFGSPRSEDRSFLRDHIENVASRLGRGAEAFIEKAKARFDSFDLRALDRKLESIKRKVRYGYDDDIIRPMSSIGQYQQAGFNCQRWVMANAKVQRMRRDDRIFGYQDTFIDRYHGRVGEDNPDHCKVVNGLVQFHEDGSNSFVQFSDAYDDEGREELDFAQQTTIRDSIWANLEAIIAMGRDDPTSPDNNCL